MMKLRLYEYSAPVEIEGPDGTVLTVMVLKGELRFAPTTTPPPKEVDLS